MAAQVEAVALQTLVKGTPNVRVEALAVQVLAAGARTVEVEAFTLQVIAPFDASATEVSGVAATVAAAAPSGAVDAASVSESALLDGVAAAVTVIAPVGAVAAVSGGSVSLNGQPSNVTMAAPAGTVLAGTPVILTGAPATVTVAAPAGDVVRGTVIMGTPARVRVQAIPGTVFVGTQPRVVETVRVTPGATGTTFSIPFTQPIEAGDVVVVAYAGVRTSFGDGRCGAHTVTGLGGSWNVSSGSIGAGNEIWWGVSADATTTGSATVTVEANRDPLLVGLIIRGTNQALELVSSNSKTIVRDAAIGEVFVAMAASTSSSLDMVNYASQPSEADWTETTGYAGTGLDKQLAYAAPRYRDQYVLDPGATTLGYDMQYLVVGQAEFDAYVSADPATVTVKAPAGSVDAQFIFPAINGGGPLTTSTLQKLRLVTMGATTLTGGGTLTTSTLLAVIPQTDMVVRGGGTIVARPQRTFVGDPRTNAEQWRYVVTDLTGTPLGELVDIEHDPIEDGVNDPASMSFTIATDDPARSLIKPVERQCQVWQGDVLRLRGPILAGNPNDDGTTITHKIHDPSWWWRDGRKRIGWVPKANLLKNGDFTRGLTYWSLGADADSIPKAPPVVSVVADDFTDGGKAAEIHGVESVTETKSELQSSAVFWPNRPFAYEPLAAGFRPGGTDAVDKVAKDMPTTAGLKVTIVGHTANDGTGNGLQLSLRRAKAAAARVKALRPGAVITTKGVGFYDPNPKFPKDAQEQRRVVISYQSTTTISGKSKQWMRQTVLVTQPKSARYSLELVGAVHLKVTDDWSVADANMVSVKMVARRQSAPSKPWDDTKGVGEASISDTDPVDRWMKASASVTIPADDRPSLVDFYLYAPAALARYTRAVLEPQEELYYWGADQALIVKGLVEHMQDPRTMLGHVWPITVGTRTPRTGVTRDRVYPHAGRMPIDTALEEFPALSRGLDIDVLTTPTQTTVATFYPQQGQTVDYPLVLGGNIARAVPANTRDVASLVIAQAQDSSTARDEAYAADPKALGGLMLQSLITAEQETPLNELDETAVNELRWAKTSTPSYWLDVHPDSMGEVLDQTGKGDTVRLILDGPDVVDRLARIVKRQIHPDGLRLMVALQEA